MMADKNRQRAAFGVNSQAKRNKHAMGEIYSGFERMKEGMDTPFAKGHKPGEVRIPPKDEEQQANRWETVRQAIGHWRR